MLSYINDDFVSYLFNFSSCIIINSSNLSDKLKLNIEKAKINSFIEWFVGISEAESNFLIRARKNKGVIIGNSSS